MLAAGAVNQEHVVRARPAVYIEVFAQFDVSVGAKDGQPPVAPGRKRVRRIPVDSNISLAPVAAKQDFAVILQAGFNPGLRNFRRRRRRPSLPWIP